MYNNNNTNDNDNNDNTNTNNNICSVTENAFRLRYKHLPIRLSEAASRAEI